MSKTTLVEEKWDRQDQVLRELVERTALQPPPSTSEELVLGIGVSNKLWNEGAERIEAMGYPFPVRIEHRGATSIAFVNTEGFPFNRALATLLIILDSGGPDPVFEFMRDTLLCFDIPSQEIEHQASASDGLWRMRWRKDKIGKAAQLAVSEAWQERENEEILESDKTRAAQRVIARAHAKLDEFVRSDPDMKDFTVGMPRMFGSPQSAMGRVSDMGSIKDNEPRDEAKILAEELREVFEELAGKSCRAAAEELNRRGIKTANGGRWYPSQVSRTRDRLRNK